MTMMAERGPGRPARWWQALTKAAAPEPLPASHCSRAPPSTPALSLPQKPSEFTTLIKAAACGFVAKNS